MATISNIYQSFNSLLSLQPLVTVLSKMISEGNPGAKKLYQGVLEEINAIPELLQPMQSPELMVKHQELVETLLSTIFPPSTSAHQGNYAVCFPFKPETIYASPAFRDLFLTGGNNVITVPDHKTGINISKATLNLAYNVILKKYYKLPVPFTATSVHPFTDKETGLTKYFELRLNAQFVEIKLVNEDFQLPKDFSPEQTLDLDELKELFPLENFQFEGLVVIDVNDVTTEQVIVEIKTALLNINAFSDVSVYQELQQHLQSLVGLKDVQIGITPFFKMNGYYLYTEAHYQNSLLFKNKEVIREKDRVSEQSQQAFRNKSQPVLYGSLRDHKQEEQTLLGYYSQQGAESLILCPLKCDDGQLIGLLEILSNEDDALQFQHVTKLGSVIPLFTLALEKSFESLELQIDKTIKEHFTAIQPAVEWKFTEAAFDYMQHRSESDMARMTNITFEHVYPLYAAIDVRHSSLERNNAIQKDLLEQLRCARKVLDKALRIMDFPLLKEIQFRIEKYIASAQESLLSDDELLIYEFLQQDFTNLLLHLRIARPEMKKAVDDYFAMLDPQRKVLYHRRREYEESLTRINDVLDRFIDSEQQSAQEIFPHYFERYITDGLEFNMYVGQSLAPHHPFDEIYVRNLKLWQLTSLAKAARLTHTLEKRLTLPLQTTQLILAHALPLSISFRRKERKFDVDGAYNIRYEIIKKRIDKVHLRDSEERLTQPGKVAIVYSQHKELQEYEEYIEFLQNEKLLGDEVEHLDLEDTQGISGLKAIRVNVNLSNDPSASATPKVELSKITSKQLLRK
jgi:hypothetical protein